MTTEANDFAAFEAAHNAPPAAEAPPPAVETPEPTAEAAEGTEPVVEAGQEPETAGEEPKEPKGRTTADRIKKMTKELREAQAVAAEVQALKAELEALKKGKEPPLTPAPEKDNTTAVGAPDPNKFQYGELDPQYLEALADYRAELKLSEFRESLRQEKEQELQRQAAQREAAALQETALKITEAGSAKYQDFSDVVAKGAEAGDWALTKEMFETVAKTEAREDILYFLATHPDESARVAEMSPLEQALWFGRKDAEYATKAAPPKPKVSQAPPPINSARGSGGRFEPSPATSDFAAFERMAMAKGR